MTLFFKKKLEEPQRKYIKIEESVDHDLTIEAESKDHVPSE